VSEQNPYSAPEALVVDHVVVGAPRLGGRGERFGAAIIDGLILVAILLPLMFASGYFSGLMQGVKPSFGMQALWGLLGFAIMVAVQGYPLAQTGQTWGKKVLKLKIVDLAGNKPEFAKLIGLRYATTQLIGLIPFVGGLYALVDVLFIFREDKRCIHDLIAGTRVVIAE
jgi:uncharacterized RDD family membrane protein YckC